MMPLLLAIETTLEKCSVALSAKGKVFVQEQSFPFQASSEGCLTLLSALLKEANVSLKECTGLAVNQGPGRFTGVRLGVSLVQGIAYGLSLPVYALSSLEILAYQADLWGEGDLWVAPAIEAHLDALYLGIYHRVGGEWRCAISPCYATPLEAVKAVQKTTHQGILLGSGWDRYYERFSGALCHYSYYEGYSPHARSLLALALSLWQKKIEGISAMQVLPVYLRDRVAEPFL